MNDILVSAVITSYKRPPEIVERAVKSIINQTYSNLEIIVVDDSPADYELRDAVRDTVLKYQDRVKYIRHEKNMGACVARNTGIDNSAGEYIAFLDDDDFWRENKIELQLKKALETNAGLIYCKCLITVEETGKQILFKQEYRTGFVYDDLLKWNFIGSTSFPLVKRECFEKCGKFDPMQPAAQDYDVWIRIAEKYEVDYVDEILVDYSVHAGERISADPFNMIKAGELILIKYNDYLKKHPKTLARRKRTIAVFYAQCRMPGKALASLLCAYVKDVSAIKDNIVVTDKVFRQYIKSLIKHYKK